MCPATLDHVRPWKSCSVRERSFQRSASNRRSGILAPVWLKAADFALLGVLTARLVYQLLEAIRLRSKIFERSNAFGRPNGLIRPLAVALVNDQCAFLDYGVPVFVGHQSQILLSRFAVQQNK
jgi:hypothetical protein